MAAGLTQAQLAQQLGCAQAHVSRWERGTVVPEAATLLRLSRILSCPMEQLITTGEG
jgi:transcriptional regulator with XRE-family HTH domain